MSSPVFYPRSVERRLVEALEDSPVVLTATEYELLRVLALDAGRAVTCETLLRRVWNGSELRQQGALTVLGVGRVIRIRHPR